MGLVYLARTPGGKLAAIKLVRDDLAHTPEFRNRFAREVRVARRVRGPFTPAVVDSDTSADVPWMATEYVPAPTLKEAVGEHGPLPPESLPVLMSGLARALEAVHAAGLMHRDLKPSNVLLSPHGPQVIDFGLARAVEGTVLTRTGQTFGTPAYSSPEQINGKDISPKSDVFSLAGTVLFAASGEPPFGSARPQETLQRILSEAPNLAAVPDGPLRDLLARCLAKDPDYRPDTEAILTELTEVEMPQDAHEWLPEPVIEEARWLSKQEAEELIRTDRTPWRRPVLVAGAAATALVLVAGGGYALTLVPEGGEGFAGEEDNASAAPATDSEGGPDGAFAPEGYQGSLFSADDVGFSPDGERVYVTGNGYFSVWDWRAGEITAFLNPSPAATDISANGTIAAVQTQAINQDNPPKIEILTDADSTLTLETTLVYDQLNTAPRNPALSSDGTRLAVTANKVVGDDTIERQIHVWDVPTGEVVLTFAPLGPGTRSYLFDLEYTADGQALVGTLSNDFNRVLGVAVWNAATGDWLHYFQGEGSMGFALHPVDPAVMALVEESNRVRLVDLETGTTLRDLGRLGEEDVEEDLLLSFSADGERLYASSDQLGTIWDTTTGEVIRDGDVLLNGPVGAHPSDEFLAVMDKRASQVTILDGENLTIVTELN